MEENVLNLSDATESQEIEFLVPGKHEVTITEVKVGPLKEGKNAVLKVTFKSDAGAIAQEVFNLVGKNDETTSKLKGRVLTLAKACGFEDSQIKGNFNILFLNGRKLRIILNLKQYIKNGKVLNGTYCKFAGFAERLNENKIAYYPKDDEFAEAPTANDVLEAVANTSSYGNIESYIQPQENILPVLPPF